MKVQFTKAVGGRAVGDEVDVLDGVGEALIAHGVAEVVETRKPRAKTTTSTPAAGGGHPRPPAP